MKKSIASTVPFPRGTSHSVEITNLIDPAGSLHEPSKVLAWWYQMAAPPAPREDASLAEREVVRRGRLASIILFFILALGLLAIPSVLFVSVVIEKSPYAFLVHLLAVSMNVLALFSNRKGHVTQAGTLVSASITLSFVFSIVYPGHISIAWLQLFALLLLPELIVVSLLPARYVFVSMTFNSLFVWYDMTFLPHAHDLDQLLATVRYGVIIIPILLYVFAAIVTYLWVRSTTHAIARADNAEQIAQLEHAMAQQQRDIEESIDAITATLVKRANGDGAARVPVEGNVFWEIAGPLNLLLERAAHSQKDADAFQIERRDLHHLSTVLSSARKPMVGKSLNTSINTIILALAEKQVVSLSAEWYTSLFDKTPSTPTTPYRKEYPSPLRRSMRS